MTASNPLKGLLTYGQSPWMDFIRRDLLTSGGLQKMIDNDGLRGMTSNPAIFEKSIESSKDYADIIEAPAGAAFFETKISQVAEGNARQRQRGIHQNL